MTDTHVSSFYDREEILDSIVDWHDTRLRNQECLALKL